MKTSHRSFPDMTKLYIVLLSLVITVFSGNAYAVDINADETETFTPIENKDLGIYILSKVVDQKTDIPLQNVMINSDLEKSQTDKNGEFFIKVSPNGFIKINYPGYKETNIRVKDLKGKIKLEVIPSYLPLYPNNTISLSYRNLGFSESFQGITATGRINDSFSVDGSIRVLNNLLIGAGYESLNGLYNRSQTTEKSSFSNNLGYLRADWIYSLLNDQLDFAFGLKGYLKSISSTAITVNQEEPRDLDFLDFNSQRLAIGPKVEVAARPIRYFPLVVGGSIAYYPFITVFQEPNSPNPKNLAGFDYNIYARFDFMKFFIKPQFMGRNAFQNSYNSGYSGLVLTAGYSF